MLLNNIVGNVLDLFLTNARGSSFLILCHAVQSTTFVIKMEQLCQTSFRSFRIPIYQRIFKWPRRGLEVIEVDSIDRGCWYGTKIHEILNSGTIAWSLVHVHIYGIAKDLFKSRISSNSRSPRK